MKHSVVRWFTILLIKNSKKYWMNRTQIIFYKSCLDSEWMDAFFLICFFHFLFSSYSLCLQYLNNLGPKLSHLLTHPYLPNSKWSTMNWKKKYHTFIQKVNLKCHHHYFLQIPSFVVDVLFVCLHNFFQIFWVHYFLNLDLDLNRLLLPIWDICFSVLVHYYY